MHACIYLLMSLIGTAGFYFTLGVDFLAATQLVVYVGGVVILMLFAVMLTGGGLEIKKIGWQILSYIPPMGSMKSYVWGAVTAVFFFFNANLYFKSSQII